MQIHHLNCGLMRPPGGRLFDGFSTGLTAALTCHCLLIEAGDGLALVDTGFGVEDMRAPMARISPFFVLLDNIRADESLTALRQIEALGYQARDVRHIVMTHLDFDHAGGLSDFPEATVHVTEREYRAAFRQDGPRARRRYPLAQLQGAGAWRTYRTRGEPWFGLQAAQELDGLPPEILFVALPGHTEGHAGVAIRDREGWLLHAGDAYFHRHEMDRPERECPPATRAYQRMMATSHDLFLFNQARLKEIYRAHPGEISVFCTHDAIEFEALSRLTAPARLTAAVTAAPDQAFESAVHQL